jgi:hypothetical protein
MIRNARNKKHGNKPYQRVDVPPEVAEQLSALSESPCLKSCPFASIFFKVGVKNSPGSPGTSSATNVSQIIY